MSNWPDVIDAEEEDYLYIEKSGLDNAGLGLFTSLTIYKNEVISIFKGEKLSHSLAKKRSLEKADAYFINLLDGSILDSANTECFAKYSNDTKGPAESDFENNAKITLDMEDNVCLVSTKKIKAGFEIFASYGPKYWLNYKDSNHSQN